MPGINRFDKPIESKFIDTYVPLPFSTLVPIWERGAKAQATINTMPEAIGTGTIDAGAGLEDALNTRYRTEMQSVASDIANSNKPLIEREAMAEQLINRFKTDPNKFEIDRRKEQEKQTEAIRVSMMGNGTWSKVHEKRYNDFKNKLYQGAIEDAESISAGGSIRKGVDYLFDPLKTQSVADALTAPADKVVGDKETNQWFAGDGTTRSSEWQTLTGNRLIKGLFSADSGLSWNVTNSATGEGNLIVKPGTDFTNLKGIGGEALSKYMLDIEDSVAADKSIPENQKDAVIQERIAKEVETMLNARVLDIRNSGVGGTKPSPGGGGPSGEYTPSSGGTQTYNISVEEEDKIRKTYAPYIDYYTAKVPGTNISRSEYVKDLRKNNRIISVMSKTQEAGQLGNAPDKDVAALWRSASAEDKAEVLKLLGSIQLKDTDKDYVIASTLVPLMKQLKREVQSAADVFAKKYNEYRGVYEEIKEQNKKNNIDPSQTNGMFINSIMNHELANKSVEKKVLGIGEVSERENYMQNFKADILRNIDNNIYAVDKEFKVDYNDPIELSDSDLRKKGSENTEPDINFAAGLSLVTNNPTSKKVAGSTRTTVVAQINGRNYAIPANTLRDQAQYALNLVDSAYDLFDLKGAATKTLVGKVPIPGYGISTVGLRRRLEPDGKGGFVPVVDMNLQTASGPKVLRGLSKEDVDEWGRTLLLNAYSNKSE